VRDQEAAPELAAESEAREVAGRGGQPDEDEHQAELDLALRRHHAAQHHGRLARGDEPDERAGLEEGERADQRVGPRAERVRQVGERRVEVGHGDDAGRREREAERGHEGDGQQSRRRPPGHAGAGTSAGRGSNGRGRTTSTTGSSIGASSAAQRAIVRRSLLSATSPIGAGIQIATAR
jgi:hypothetical protein